AAPGADIALELPLGLECRTVRGLHRCVALSHWISELNWSKVCCKAKPNLDGAGIVDAEGSSRIDQRQSLQRPRFQASRRRQRGRAHQIGPVHRIWHWKLELDAGGDGKASSTYTLSGMELELGGRFVLLNYTSRARRHQQYSPPPTLRSSIGPYLDFAA